MAGPFKIRLLVQIDRQGHRFRAENVHKPPIVGLSASQIGRQTYAVCKCASYDRRNDSKIPQQTFYAASSRRGRGPKTSL